MSVNMLRLVLPAPVSAILHMGPRLLRADDNPDFRALQIPDGICLCHSPEVLGVLRLSDAQP